jgi:sporulation protein YlmC with PRC-barrel domain
MRSVNRALPALGFLIVMVGATAQTSGDEAGAASEESASSEIHSQTLRPARTQIAQASSTTAGSTETTISVKSLLDAKVLDSTNRELGTLGSLLMDPQTGKLVRADIKLKGGGGVMGKGGDQQISVPWEQLSVKRQEGNFVVVLNQEAMQKIQSIQQQDGSEKKQKNK